MQWCGMDSFGTVEPAQGLALCSSCCAKGNSTASWVAPTLRLVFFGAPALLQWLAMQPHLNQSAGRRVRVTCAPPASHHPAGLRQVRPAGPWRRLHGMPRPLLRLHMRGAVRVVVPVVRGGLAAARGVRGGHPGDDAAVGADGAPVPSGHSAHRHPPRWLVIRGGGVDGLGVPRLGWARHPQGLG